MKNIIYVITIISIIIAGSYYYSQLNDEDCSIISDNSKLIDCYVNLVIKNDDPLICDQIPNNDLILNCYQKSAFTSNNLDYCDYIKQDKFQSNCVYTVFNNRLPREELCKKIRNITSKGFCIRQIANKENNISICTQIEDTTENQYCLDNLAEGALQINSQDYIKKTNFDCSEIDVECGSRNWIEGNINEIMGDIGIICNNLCRNISRKSGGYRLEIDSTNVGCTCK